MAASELSLFADLDQGRLVQGFLSTLQATLPRFVFGDSIPVSFRPLKSNGNNSVNPWSEVDLTGKTVRIAIGNPGGAPSSGTFTLSYGGDTSAAIAYNADGAAIQTALNALASITADGGVVVTRAGTTGAFRIVWNTSGVRTAVTASTESLYPSAGAEIRVSVEGSVSAREIVVARLETLPAAFAELEDEFPVAASEIVEVRTGSGSVGAIVSLRFSVLPYSGSYSLEIDGEQTLGIPWDADSSILQAALELLSSVGSGKVVVSGEFPAFTLNFDLTLGDIGAMTIDMTGLVVPKGRAGLLSTNTAAMIELLNGAAQATAKLEVELYDIGDGTTWTVLQTDCTVIDDVIGNSPATTPAFPSVLSMIIPGDTAPVLEATAEVTINPAGANNSILFTSIATGSIGNNISIAYDAPASQATTDVSVSGNSITVIPGDHARISISGALTSNGSTPVTFPEMAANGVLNSKPFYDNPDTDSVNSDSTKWLIFSASPEAYWESSDHPATPDLVTTWIPLGAATGTPVITLLASSAQQVIDAANGSGEASALVTASASGIVTGAVAAVAATNLAGGIDTTMTPPYMRIAGGFLYVLEGSEWKKVALSSL